MIKIGLEDTTFCCLYWTSELNVRRSGHYVALSIRGVTVCSETNMPYSDTVSVNFVKIKLVRFLRYFVAESPYVLLFCRFKNQHFVTK